MSGSHTAVVVFIEPKSRFKAYRLVDSNSDFAS